MKKRTLIFSVIAMLFTSPLLAQETGKTIINTFLQDWLLPIFVLFIIGIAIRAYIVNADLIADKNEEGTMIKGFKNMGKQLLFASLGFAILVAIIAAANAFIGSVSVG